jgi:(S)-ureidoglycine aminohydrolase
MPSTMLAVALLFAATGAVAQTETPTETRTDTRTDTLTDTLTARVSNYPGPNNPMLKGATHDLALLDVRTLTIQSAISISDHPDSADELLIVKEGELNLTSGDSTTTIDAGGVALIPAGVGYSLDATQTTYYRFRFQSHGSTPVRAATAAKMPFFIRWADIPVQPTAKGETRPIFSRPTRWLAKIDLHATTLNPGEVSHPPHIHRAEEIILMRSGHAQLYINGKHYPAAAGDLVYFPSGNPHALENRSSDRCEYFALQWQP